MDFDEEDINDQLTQNKLKVFNKQVTSKHSFDLPTNKHSLLHYIHVFFFRARNDKIQILIYMFKTKHSIDSRKEGSDIS